MIGPEPMDHQARLALARQMVERARAGHADELLAAGVYGSMARGTDGPYSDIEILCVLRTPDAEFTYEWTHGPWKAEVDFLGRDTALGKAAEVDGDWPLTHGSFVHLLALHDPKGFLPELAKTALSQPDARFDRAMRGLIVGELYEWIGKLRNARHRGHAAPLPEIAVDMAKRSAFLLGLANRHLYTTGSRVLEESLDLPGRPAGHDALCRMAMEGRLADATALALACEHLWAGLVEWAAARGLWIVEERPIPY